MNEKDLELLIKIAAREQRYACVELANQHGDGLTPGEIQNTPCPDVADVLKRWREAVANSKDGEE